MSMNHTAKQSHSFGFSLIELMVTIVIASILIAIAVPTYKNQIRKSRRTDAKTALLDLAAREERYYNTSGTSTYTTTPSNLGYTGTTWPISVGSNYYQLNTPVLTAANPTTSTAAYVTLTAVPVAGSDQALDTQCASFTVTSTGLQTALNSASTLNTANCW